ncbi:MAG: DUF58 domain-containing protein [Endomicrobiia bacterium]
MLPQEILKQVRRIEFKTNKIVNDLFAGQYYSVFKGRGIEFDEVREYNPGDDIRSIDWNVTARYGKPFIKKFVEERELTIMLLLDMSASQYYGSSKKTKSEIVAEIASILAFSALKNNDKVGAIIFTNQIELYIPAKKSLSHSLRIIREILYYKPKNKTTNIKNALEYFYHTQKKRCIAFLFSDFFDIGYEQALKVISKKHDIILINTMDIKEKVIDTPSYFEFEDMETGKTIEVDFRNKNLVKNFTQNVQDKIDYLNNITKKFDIDRIDIDTDKPYIEPLLKFFYKREKMFR